MLLAEPGATQYDLRFDIGGIPVRVHPMFWLVTVILGMNLPTSWLLLWVVAVFLSIIVHEMGHALAAKAFGYRPRVVLHGMGGLAIYQPTYHYPWRQIAITAAGPGAGFLLALLLIAGLYAFNAYVPFLKWPIGGNNVIENENARVLLYFLLQVNIIWGMINLLPIFPLDGGQIAREVWALGDPRGGTRKAIVLSIVTAVVAAALAYSYTQDLYLTIFFVYFAFNNYLILKQFGGGNYGGGSYDDERYRSGRDW